MFVSSRKLEEKEQEIEQELSFKQNMVEKYSRGFSQVSDRMRKAWDDARAGYRQMESGREKLAEHSVKAREAIEEAIEQEKQRKEKTKDIKKQAGRLEKEAERTAGNCRRAVARIQGQHEDFLEMIGQSEKFISPLEIVHPAAEEMSREIEEMKKQAGQMSGFGKQMEMLSLNAAIEAGRLGEGGRKFVEAAEEVRGLSGQYCQAAAALDEKMGRLTAMLEDAEEQVAHLTRLLKGQNARMERTAGELGENVAKLEEADVQGLSVKMRELAGEMEQAFLGQDGLAKPLEEAAEAAGQVEKGLDAQEEEIGRLQRKAEEAADWLGKAGRGMEEKKP